MPQSIPRLILGGVVMVVSLAAFAADAKKPGKPAPRPVIEKLIWLAGNWRLERSGRLIEEQWMTPAGGVMLGMARTVAKGRLVEYEFVQIREGPGGELFYVAQPSGQKEATFPIKTLADNAVVFENELHDFPQRISYTLLADGSLLAAIEGPGPDGQPKRIEFPYQRVQK